MSNTDPSQLTESASVGVDVFNRDAQVWKCHSVAEKLYIPDTFAMRKLKDIRAIERFTSVDGITAGEAQRAILLNAGVEPEIVEVPNNLLMYGGASCQWQTLIGNGTNTAGQNLTFFNNTNAAIGVGDSTTAAAATQTDLRATTNKLRVAMDSTYPTHADATSSGAATIVFRSTFSTSQGNYAWQEWGVFNSATAGVGRMLQRKVESLGTKTSASTWTLTLTLSIA